MSIADLQTVPLLVLIMGAPCSGKTAVGEALHAVFPGLAFVSGGDLARIATSADVIAKSPHLRSIAQQLQNDAKRKKAARQLNDMVIKAIAAGFKSALAQYNGDVGASPRNARCADTKSERPVGLVVDGIRAADVTSLENAMAAEVSCVVWLYGPRDVLIARQQARGSRGGDEALFGANSTHDVGRIDAYLAREDSEDIALWSLLQGRGSEELYEEVVYWIECSAPLTHVANLAVDAVRQRCTSLAAQASGLGNSLKRAEHSIGCVIDWGDALVEASLDRIPLRRASQATPTHSRVYDHANRQV